MTATGTWNLTMATPMGEQKSRLIVTDTGAQMETPEGEFKDVLDFMRDGNALKWKVQVTKPMPLKLHFDVTTDGDELTGKFRPGMFPASPVSGTRAA